MKLSKLVIFSSMVLTLVMILGAGIDLSAQGKGKGNSPTKTTQPTTSPSTPRTTTATTKTTTTKTSTAKSDSGKTTSKSNMPSDTELNRYNGISKKLNMTPADLNTQFQTALAANSKLTFGQFVAANVVASNLSDKNASVTTDAILAGLASGKSIGQTLQSLGVDAATSKTAEKNAKKQIKDSQKSP